MCEYIFAIVFVLWLLNSISIGHLSDVRYLWLFRNTLLINFAMGKWWQCSWGNITCSYTRVSINPSPAEALNLISPKIPCVFKLHQHWVSAMVLSCPLLPSYVLAQSYHLLSPVTRWVHSKVDFYAERTNTLPRPLLLPDVCALRSCHLRRHSEKDRSAATAIYIPHFCLRFQGSLFKCQYWFVKHEQSWGEK